MKNYLYITLSLLLFASCKPEETTVSGPQKLDIRYPILFGTPRNLPSDNELTVEGVDLGRHLFYDKMLSIDHTRSCASCHIQEFAFSDTAKFSSGINGKVTKRQSMSLSNLSYQTDFFWDGRTKTLEEQSLHPIRDQNEMGLEISELISRLNASEFYQEKFNRAFPNEPIDSTTLAKAIAQFERTLISGSSRYDLIKLNLATATEQEKRGERLFFTHPDPSIGDRGGNCGDCHSGFLTYSNSFANNGLDEVITDVGLENVTGNSNDKGRFKIPSLRNIELTPPYMHDGRFKTLEEVVDHYNEHIQVSPTLDIQIIEASNNTPPLHNSLGLTAQEKEDIVAFLKTLTDENFISNPSHKNPFN